MGQARTRIVFACVLSLVLGCAGLPKNGMSMAKAYETVQKGTPVGTTMEKAEKWAKSKGYPSTPITSPAKDRDVVSMEIDMKDVGGVLEIMIYDIHRTLKGVSDARVLLILDQDNKVKYHKVKLEYHES